MLKFPDGFYWGAATSSFQVEGGIENIDWAKAGREGRVPVIGDACDHYHRYEDDFDIAKQLGHNCHRLSIEWARIEPSEGQFDSHAIEHYRNVLRALHRRGLEPFITIWHFTLPLWFSESGGFERKDAPAIFARYCAYIVEQLGDLCDHYCTINELHPYVSNGWRRGTWPPFKKWPGIDRVNIPGYRNELDAKNDVGVRNIWKYITVFHRLAWAHNRAYEAIKRVRPQVEVGIVHHVVLFHANDNPFNRVLAWIMNWHWTHYLFLILRGKYDVIGVNYYLHKKFGDRRVYEKTDMGWDSYPEGIADALHMMKRYKVPVYVSEAGVADAADRIRASYIRDLVRGIHAAISRGVDVRGFMYWSLLDNYELAQGYTRRFGLVEVDFATQIRSVRDSAYVYETICRSNALED